MFKRLADAGTAVALTVDGKPVQAQERRHGRRGAAGGRHRPLPHDAGDGRAARAILPDGRLLRLPGDHRRRRQPPGLPGAGARGHDGGDADRQARGGTMTHAFCTRSRAREGPLLRLMSARDARGARMTKAKPMNAADLASSYDLVVIGGGPAGLAAASLAARAGVSDRAVRRESRRRRPDLSRHHLHAGHATARSWARTIGPARRSPTRPRRAAR